MLLHGSQKPYITRVPYMYWGNIHVLQMYVSPSNLHTQVLKLESFRFERRTSFLAYSLKIDTLKSFNIVFFTTKVGLFPFRGRYLK